MVGDLILDLHVSGDVDRISPEAPIPVLRVATKETSPGGAANVACKVAELEGDAVLAGIVGRDEAAKKLLDESRGAGVEVSAVVEDAARPTTRKTRYVARGQQLLRVDHEAADPVSGPAEDELVARVAREVASCAGVVIEDYGKGALTRRVLDAALSRSGEIPVVVDPHGRGWGRYHGATVLTPNVHEAEVASGMTIRSEKDIAEAGRRLLEEAGAGCVAVTRGSEGIALVTADAVEMIPTVPVEVFDVTGAGDAVAAVFALGLAGGLSLRQSGEVANLAGGVIVRQLGVGHISREAMRRGAALRAGRGASGAASLEEVVAAARRVRAGGGKVVFTNGCFDLLHAGHVRLLAEARALGDFLIVCINSDESIRRLKGPARPILREDERAQVLGSLSSVDMVAVFEEDTPARVIREISPDVLAKGADYAEDEIVGAEWVKSRGGTVARIPLVEGTSTSAILERVVERHSAAEPPADGGSGRA